MIVWKEPSVPASMPLSPFMPVPTPCWQLMRSQKQTASIRCDMQTYFKQSMLSANDIELQQQLAIEGKVSKQSVRCGE